MDNFTIEVIEKFIKVQREILVAAEVPPHLKTPDENIATLNLITDTALKALKEVNAMFIEAVEKMKSDVSKTIIQCEGDEQ